MSQLPYLDHDALLKLATEAAHVAQPCTCTKTPLHLNNASWMWWIWELLANNP